jgi:hypothetical protein
MLDKYQRFGETVAMAYFNVLWRYSPDGTDKNSENFIQDKPFAISIN